MLQIIKNSFLNQNKNKYKTDVSINCKLTVVLLLHSSAAHPCFHWGVRSVLVVSDCINTTADLIIGWRDDTQLSFFKISHITPRSQAVLVYFIKVLPTEVCFSFFTDFNFCAMTCAGQEGLKAFYEVWSQDADPTDLVQPEVIRSVENKPVLDSLCKGVLFLDVHACMHLATVVRFAEGGREKVRDCVCFTG